MAMSLFAAQGILQSTVISSLFTELFSIRTVDKQRVAV
jgi:hypothetical protein